VDSDSLECDFEDANANQFILDAYQFRSNTDASDYFNWLVEHNEGSVSACGPIAQDPCTTPWSNARFPASSGQVMVAADPNTGSGANELWWILPSQNAVFVLTPPSGDASSVFALTWFDQNVSTS
jgi:hypothetical protein